MIFAFIKDGTVTNIAEFESQESVNELKPSFIGGNDDIIFCPDEYGIGDFCNNGTWEKAPAPEPAEPEPEPEPEPGQLTSDEVDFVKGLYSEAGGISDE